MGGTEGEMESKNIHLLQKRPKKFKEREVKGETAAPFRVGRGGMGTKRVHLKKGCGSPSLTNTNPGKSPKGNHWR